MNYRILNVGINLMLYFCNRDGYFIFFLRVSLLATFFFCLQVSNEFSLSPPLSHFYIYSIHSLVFLPSFRQNIARVEDRRFRDGSRFVIQQPRRGSWLSWRGSRVGPKRNAELVSAHFFIFSTSSASFSRSVNIL